VDDPCSFASVVVAIALVGTNMLWLVMVVVVVVLVVVMVVDIAGWSDSK
jgi:hypothetical protein